MENIIPNVYKKYNVRIKDGDIKLVSDNTENPTEDIPLEEVIKGYLQYKKCRVIYKYDETNIKFIRDIKKKVINIVNDTAKNCTSIKYVELKEDETIEDVIENHKKYITIKIPYLLYEIK